MGQILGERMDDARYLEQFTNMTYVYAKTRRNGGELKGLGVVTKQAFGYAQEISM